MFWFDYLMIYRIIIVGEALQGKEIGIEDVIVIDIGTVLALCFITLYGLM